MRGLTGSSPGDGDAGAFCPSYPGVGGSPGTVPCRACCPSPTASKSSPGAQAPSLAGSRLYRMEKQVKTLQGPAAAAGGSPGA